MNAALLSATPAAVRRRPDFHGLFISLMRQARFPDDLRTQALAGVIAKGMARGAGRILRGLDENRFQQLIKTCFPGAILHNGHMETGSEYDEYDDLVALLREHCCDDSPVGEWLCHAIASAGMHDEHLWQDMGLPDRAALNLLLRENFPSLVERNVGDMKWKKFFYRQLCERAGVMICKSPNCAVCSDHAICFGPET